MKNKYDDKNYRAGWDTYFVSREVPLETAKKMVENKYGKVFNWGVSHGVPLRGTDEIPTCLKYITDFQWNDNYIFLVLYERTGETLEDKEVSDYYLINFQKNGEPADYKYYEY